MILGRFLLKNVSFWEIAVGSLRCRVGPVAAAAEPCLAVLREQASRTQHGPDERGSLLKIQTQFHVNGNCNFASLRPQITE